FTYLTLNLSKNNLKTFNSILRFSSIKKTIITLGTFDGVHLGHQAILKKLVNATENGTYESLVLTFYPHPRMVLNQEGTMHLLNTIEEKTILLEKYGIDDLIIHPFDEKFSKLSAEAFVKSVLVDQLNIHKIIIGYDHRFGENRSANITDLIEFGKKYNFEVVQINAEEINEISISSTKIRTALLDGAIELANQYLGYDYFFSGKVIKGKQLGRTIGFPTANIVLLKTYKLIPKNGVYIVYSTLNNKRVYGMMNIGHNPTVGENNKTIEVHFFDINEDLYDKIVTVSILKFIRSEEKFESIDALKMQLNKDREFSKSYLREQTPES
ncbi:bifunctional riboflavin kinase/FAD synthetase, partial [Flavobacterium sp.]|uniref:bifunctional riboflavin kinase/FAD synthetase n=1 Tax=Flavobacterium sp. TaxID=239 RepID=UPI0037BFE834